MFHLQNSIQFESNSVRSETKLYLKKCPKPKHTSTVICLNKISKSRTSTTIKRASNKRAHLQRHSTKKSLLKLRHDILTSTLIQDENPLSSLSAIMEKPVKPSKSKVNKFKSLNIFSRFKRSSDKKSCLKCNHDQLTIVPEFKIWIV